jgi:hypothetical protein
MLWIEFCFCGGGGGDNNSVVRLQVLPAFHLVLKHLLLGPTGAFSFSATDPTATIASATVIMVRITAAATAAVRVAAIDGMTAAVPFFL